MAQQVGYALGVICLTAVEVAFTARDLCGSRQMQQGGNETSEGIIFK